MTRTVLAGFPFLLVVPLAAGQDALFKAAVRYILGVKWRANSVVLADFTCVGHKQPAILGTNSTEIVVAVFINGTGARPEVIRYSARVRSPAHATLKVEGLDYDPTQDPGYELPGFKRSKFCKGLTLSDGETDSTHIYWDHTSKQFDDWVR